MIHRALVPFAILCLTGVHGLNHEGRAIQYSNATTSASTASTVSSSSSAISSSLLVSASSTASSTLFQSSSSTSVAYTASGLVTAASPASPIHSAIASTTTTSNVTSLNASTTAAPNDTLAFCCNQLFQPGIGLVAWYTGSQIYATVATVVSVYGQYNNTKVLESVHTINSTNATAFYGTYHVDQVYHETTTVVPGLPNTIVPWADNLYGGTVVGSHTEIVFPNQSLTITSPTPFWAYGTIPFLTGASTIGHNNTVCPLLPHTYPATTATITSDDTTLTSTISAITSYETSYDSDVGDLQFYQANFIVEGPVAIVYDGNASAWLESSNTDNFDSGAGDVFVYPGNIIDDLEKIPFVVSQLPQIQSCIPISGGEGAPTVHVPVSELTATTESVITRTGLYTGKTTSMPLEASSVEQLLPGSGLITSSSSTSSASDLTAEDLRPGTALISSDQSITSSSTSSDGTYTAEVLDPSTGLVPNTDVAPTTATTSTQSDASPSNDGSAGTSPSNTQAPAPADSPTTGNAATTTTGDAVSPTGSPDTSNGQSNEPSSSGAGVGTANVDSAGPTSAAVSWVSTIAVQAAAPTSGSQDAVAPVLTLPSTTVSPDSAAQYDLGSGQTLSPNGPAVTHAGDTYSISAGPYETVLYSNGVSSALVQVPSSADAGANAASTPAPVINVGSAAVTQNAASQYIIPASVAGSSSDQTLVPGGSAVTDASGTVYSIPSAGTAVVVNGHTSSIVTPAGPVVTFGSGSSSGSDTGSNGGEGGSAGVGVAATPVGSSGEYIVAAQTLSPGGSAVVVSGTTYSIPAGSSGTTGVVVINGVTTSIPTAAASPAAPAAFSGASATSVPEYVVAGTTLVAGGSAITVSGSTISLAAGGSTIYVNGQPSTLSNSGSGSGSKSVVSIAGVAATPITASAYMIAGQTLLPGGSAITVSGTTYSLPASGSSGASIVINGVTSPLPSSFATGAAALGASGVQTITLANSAYQVSQVVVSGTTEVVVGTQTLAPGSMITVAGTTLSLAPGGTGILVAAGGTTQTADAVAAAIMSVLGEGVTSISSGSAKETGSSKSISSKGSTSKSGSGSSITASVTGGGATAANSAGLGSTSTSSGGAATQLSGVGYSGGMVGLLLGLAAWL